MKSLALLLAGTQLGQGVPQVGPQTAAIPTVKVAGQASNAGVHREFAIGRIIIGRKRIEESGMRKVHELLKREPSVTVSNDGRIGLLNLPGYTQVLIDGQPPSGKSPGEIDLVHVERIEIVKSSMAEYGPVGIAGTINIVPRKASRKTSTNVSSGFSSFSGNPGASVALSHNRSTEGSPYRFSLRLSADSSKKPVTSDTLQTRAVSGQAETVAWVSHTRGKTTDHSLSTSADVTWQRGADSAISVSPDLQWSRSSSSHAEFKTWPDRSVTLFSEFSPSSFAIFTLPIKWDINLTPESKLGITLRAAGGRIRDLENRSYFPSTGVQAERSADRRTNLDSEIFDAVYKVRFADRHDVKTGFKMLRVENNLVHQSRAGDQSDAAMDALGTRSRTRSREFRIYLQDEWHLNKIAVNAGVSMQNTAIRVDENLYQGSSRFRLWAPSINVSRPIGTGNSRQLRVSLARTFKAPDSYSLTRRPRIHPMAPCSLSGSCGPNSIDTADTTGNVDLRPERSLGLNASYEHGLGSSSQITLEAFMRTIGDKTGAAIALETVPWATTPRYVSRPINLGDARAAGAGVELDLALKDLVADLPKLVLRGSAQFASSHVSDIPGPENRLEKQSPWTLKLGGTYGLKSIPLSLDVDANLKPSTWVRTSRLERASTARRLSVDASAQMSLEGGRRIVISWKKDLLDHAGTIDEYFAINEIVRDYTTSKSVSQIRIQIEGTLMPNR